MKQAIVACAIIHRIVDNHVEILLTQRSLSSSFLPGAFEIPGGHIEYGEDLEAGLLREIKEELNIEIKIERIFRAFTYNHNDVHTVELVYLSTTPSDSTDIIFQEDEIESYKWIRADEVDTIVAKTKDAHDPEIAIIKAVFKEINNNYRTKNT